MFGLRTVRSIIVSPQNMNGNLTRSTVFAPQEGDSAQMPRRSLSRFVFDRLQEYGITARVESLRSTTRTFLLISLAADAARATNVMGDHGNAVSEQIMREIRESFGETPNLAGIYWRVEPSTSPTPESNELFQRARAALEAKIRERRAARSPESA